MGTLFRLREERGETVDLAAALESGFARLRPQTIIDLAASYQFPGAIAAVSSFGADSAVLLHMIAEVDRNLPVVFLDTGQHFGETLAYRDALIADFGLTSIAVVRPDENRLAAGDPDGTLHACDPDACCALRKVEPMAHAVAPYAAWFTGRKRFQASSRAQLPVFEASGGRVRVNPLAHLGAGDIAAYVARHGLREHPLVAYGYRSIGCFPCTRPVAAGEDDRAGRWAGTAKTECGIHLSGLDASLNASVL